MSQKQSLYWPSALVHKVRHSFPYVLKASLAATNCDACIFVLDTDDVAEVPTQQQIKDSTVREGKWKDFIEYFQTIFQSLPLLGIISLP